MLGKRNYKAIGATFVVALTTGYVMQNGDALASRFASATSQNRQVPVAVEVQLAGSDEVIAPVSAEMGLPTPAAPILPEKSGLSERVNEAEQGYTAPILDDGQKYSPFGIACGPTLTASKSAGATVALEFKAPCHPDETVTVLHEGLAFTAVTSSVGQFSVSVPALSAKADFDVKLLGDEVISASVDVPDMEEFDRVAVQWVGESKLKIHALEMGADYGDGGHVWAGAPRSVAQAMQARGGYLTTLGSVNLPSAKHAEVYSFPTGQIDKTGVVRLSIEAEITAQTCDKDIEAQALQNGIDGGVSIIDISLAMPSCDAVGDFLVLNNLLRDLKIAQN